MSEPFVIRQIDSDAPRRTPSTLPLIGAQVLLTSVLLCLIFQVWRRDLHVPLEFSHDALEYLIQAKGTLENGWWWSNPRLSAPGSFQQIAYASNSNVDQLMVLLVGRFSQDVALCLNATWVIFTIAAGAIATWCFLRMGLSSRAATRT